MTGPLAADAAVLLGNYSGVSGSLVTVLEGVVAAVDPTTMVSYEQGSLLDRPNITDATIMIAPWITSDTTTPTYPESSTYNNITSTPTPNVSHFSHPNRTDATL